MNLFAPPPPPPCTTTARHHSTNELENASLDRGTEIGSMILSYTASMESLHHSHRPSLASITGLQPRRKKPFINPFDPTKVHSELAAHHRRWIHAFPRNAEGQLFQQHHTREAPTSPTRSQKSVESLDSHGTTPRSSQAEQHPFEGTGSGARLSQGEPHPVPTTSDGTPGGLKLSLTTTPSPHLSEGNASATLSVGEGHHRSPSPLTLADASRISGNSSEVSLKKEDSSIPVFRRQRQTSKPVLSSLLQASRGVASSGRRDSKGVENFASVQRTGTDWQSLTEPACLPITCDHFPTNSELSHDFVEHLFTFFVNTLDTTASTSQQT